MIYIETENLYKCEQCGKMVPKTNYYGIKINDKTIHVCGKHNTQYRKYHKFLDDSPITQYDRNKYEITQDGVWIYCTNRQGEITGKFLIDESDLQDVIKCKWRYARGNYCTGNTKVIQIHTFLMRPNNNQVVDHINGDRTDNRRKNLRVTTQAKNCINRAIPSNNTSGIIGVPWDKERKKWAPEIKINYRRCHLGRYDKFEDAVYARYIAELLLFENYRSFRNDDNIMKYTDMCMDKNRIETYVSEKLLNKHFFDEN